MKVNEIVTNKIIEKLKQGKIAWHKPWTGTCSARNWVTQKEYSGINRLLLDDGEYLTFKQIKDNNGTLKAGAKANMCVFYSPLEKDNEETADEKKVFILRYYNVFNINDVEGIKSKQKELVAKPNFTIENCEKITEDYANRVKLVLDKDGISGRAYYNIEKDYVKMPNIKQFDDSQSYYATLYHELGHSTGHHSRLNRFKDEAKLASFGSKEYSKEELIAEIVAASLCSETGIDNDSLLENSTAYIQSWVKVLENDNNFIISASSKAEKAINLILGKDEKVENETVS